MAGLAGSTRTMRMAHYDTHTEMNSQLRLAVFVHENIESLPFSIRKDTTIAIVSLHFLALPIQNYSIFQLDNTNIALNITPEPDFNLN